MARQHLLPLLACALLCGGLLASSSALSQAMTSCTSNIPDETLCEWWRGKMGMWPNAGVLSYSLLQKREELTREYNRFTSRVRNVVADAQHSAMDKAWIDVHQKCWEGFLLTSEWSREANAIAADALS
ncbi:hypothetical protein TRVL_06461 [Trypanosoma vivax]|nr:hypothetical protein TRVL_06461 [Trypanosoma vivax]